MFWSVVDYEVRERVAFWCCHWERRIELNDQGYATQSIFKMFATKLPVPSQI